jgi:hypothetical protein
MKTLLISILALALFGTPSFAAGKGGKGKGKSDPVAAYIKQHDKNNNGTIEASEAPISATTFNQNDKNHDGKLDHGEIAEMLHVKK